MSIAVPLYGFGVSGGSPNKSTIIVTAPTGSTVTCKMGSITKTATEKNGIWTFGGLDLGTWTITSTKGGDSATQDVVITRLTVEYVTIVYRITPEFTYTGDYEIVDDSDNPISDFASWKGNWKVRFLTSGTFTVTKLNGWNGQLDVFLVGGGGSRAASNNSDWDGYAGGGSGYTETSKNIQVMVGTAYSITVGAKDSSGASSGGTSTAFGSTANGGQSGLPSGIGGKGGSGGGGAPHVNHNGVESNGWDGAGAGNGGTDGNNGTSGYYQYGVGQGTTTREFGEASAKRYSAGGPGVGIGTDAPIGAMGTVDVPLANSGSAGYSGIVVIRNTRGAA